TGRGRRPRASPRSGTRTSRHPRGTRPGTQSQQVLARVEKHAEAPRVRQRLQRSLRAVDVRLQVALGGHPLLRPEVAVEARDELTEALEMLQRRRAVRLAEGHQLTL